MTTNHIGETATNGLLATGGILGAAGAASCCLLPLVLALTGVSGAWIGALAALAPFQPVFLAIAGMSIGWGLWRVHRASRRACAGPNCGTTTSRCVTAGVLWLAAVVTAAAATIEWWIPVLVS